MRTRYKKRRKRRYKKSHTLAQLLLRQERREAKKRGNSVCSLCKVEKPLPEFYTNNRNIHSHCKECNNKATSKISSIQKNKDKARWKHIFRTYGITKEQWYGIYAEQEGRCYICLRDEEKIRRSRSKHLTVDHCHSTGKIRGLLCSNCNGAILPAFERDNKMAERIFVYLTKEKDYGIVPGFKNSATV